MRKIIIITTLLLIGMGFTVASAQSKYDPVPFIDQMHAISRTVNNDNWSQANGEYSQLASLCQQIGSNYPNLSVAANDCAYGAYTVIRGSVCNGNCHTDYNIRTYGAVVDRGLRIIDSASTTLSASN